MKTTETTWGALVHEVEAVAQVTQRDHVIYQRQRDKTYGYMPSEAWEQRQTAQAFDFPQAPYPDRLIACVFGEPIVERGEVVCTYEEADERWTIHQDKIVQLRR